MTVLSITQSQIDKGLLFSNFYWGGSTITYSIPDGRTSWVPGYEEAANASYSEFTAAQAAQFVSAIELWDSYIATSLEQVDDGTTYGDIRIAYTDIESASTWGYAHVPPYLGSGTWPESGDIWIDAANKGSLYTVGSYDYMALLHEIGHALGLKHPFEAPALPKTLDSSAYTLMSYNNSFEWRITFTVFGYSYSRVDDATPMVLDIAAIQSCYGADTATAAGATTYKITDEMTLSRRAIYDASGTDTIDLSALSRGSHLDLRPGAYSDLAYYAKADQIAAVKAAYPGMSSTFIEGAFDDETYAWTNNFGIAYSTVIENAIGSRFNDTIRGNDANNSLDGGLGTDTLTGGGGLDWFHGAIASLHGTTFTDLEAGETITFDNAGATVTRVIRSGDAIFVDVRTSATGPVQNVTLRGLGEIGPLLFEGKTITVGGGAKDDLFAGRTGNDTYSGGGGIDTVDYGAARKVLTVDLGLTTAQKTGSDFGYDKLLSIENLFGGAAGDRLAGNAAPNILRGGGGGDVIDGRAGNDTLYGEAGNDTYVVDNPGDVVREDSVAGIDDGGVDLVQASITFTLGSFVEKLTLTGKLAIDGNGNALANVITGNNAANRLSGFEGADRLDGAGGDDILRGGAGRDILIGGSGRDDLDGGEDGDTYYVGVIDTVMDSGTTGIDLVISEANFTLKTGSGIENLRSAATAPAANLTGNELDNAITGYDAHNMISGMAGVDTIRAGAGNDTIRGGLGADKLYGEAGRDVFVFRKGESLATTGRDGADLIYDFKTGEDRIDLALYAGSAPAASYAEIAVSSDNFTVLKKAAEAAMTGGVKTIFVAGQKNGWLFWSSNGLDGTAEEAVKLNGCDTLAGFDRMDLI